MKHLREFISKLRNHVSAGWRWYRRQFPLILALTALALIALWFYNFGWSGFGSYTTSMGEAIPAKTLWDWLGLLIVPALLLIGGVWINTSVQQIERERTEKRAEVDRQIADDRLKEQTLQTYLDRMSDLMLKNQFDDPTIGKMAKTIARAWTLTTLSALDGERKGTLVRFLYEAELISGNTPIVELHDADLRRANLFGANLKDVNLESTDMRDVNLAWAHLEKANLKRTRLEGAILRVATLDEADLEGAHLDGTNLEKAGLKDANITHEQLKNAILSDWTMLPDGSFYGIPPRTPAKQPSPSETSPDPPQ